MSTNASKIFGIGLSKTGTTSLAHALEILGYKTKDYPGISRYKAGDLSSVDMEVVKAHDALTDTPIPSFYRELDGVFPGSKFILTVRDREGWLKSCRKQFTEKSAAKQNIAQSQLFVDLYETNVFDEHKFASGYDRFVEGVIDYFKGRPQDLLVMNVTGGEGWEKLCPFVGKPVPDVPFPKANVTQITWMNVGDIVAVARRAGRIALRVQERHHGSGQLGRVLRRLRGGNAGSLTDASLAVDTSIAEGLRALNPSIPILSRVHHSVPFVDRANWNHLWLVDPIDGADAFMAARDDFTVNIALIQDGAPMYGVVYVPKTDIAYFARVGTGAFRTVGDRPAEPLHARSATPGERVPVASNKSGFSQPASRALAACLVAEGSLASCAWDSPTGEWQIAAAHLIAASCGATVHDGRTRQPPRYNRARLASDSIVVTRAGQPQRR
jgi:3'-phosphoadenosine 5'-phosphosulfate (PAPS) 3'-phosphatase